MIKSKFATKLADKNSHLYIQDVDRIVNIVLNETTNALGEGGRVELRGLCTFTVKSRQARKGRNPRTGSSVDIASKRALAFRCSTGLQRRLNTPEAFARERTDRYLSGARGTMVKAIDNE